MFSLPLRSQKEEEENDRHAEGLFFHLYYAVKSLVNGLIGIAQEKV